MSNDVKALIAEARGWNARVVRNHVSSGYLDMINDLADALEAATAAPAVAVDREALAKVLRDAHFDGSGCGTNGAGGCSNCHGPSPLSATEVVDTIMAALGARDVRGVQAEALERAAGAIASGGDLDTIPVAAWLNLRAQAIREARNER